MHRAYEHRESVFHVTIHTHPQVGTLSEGVADAVWNVLMDERLLQRVILHCACLMPDHLHVLVSPGAFGVIKWVNAFKSLTTNRSWAAGNKRALWQPRLWDRTMRDATEVAAVRDYILANPVNAGLVAEVQDWPWVWSVD
jgi:REP element-mobilizing transposase RayT